MRFSKLVSILFQSKIFRFLFVISILSGISYFVITTTLDLSANITNTLTYGIIGQPQRINPLWKSMNPVDESLVDVIYRSLIQYDESNRPVGDLADHWEISDDGKEYTVFLRQDQTWQDNQPITAGDVVFTYQITQTADYKGPEKMRFQDVKIEKIDDYSVKFLLKEPFSPFLESLTLEILPQHIWGNLSLSEMISSKHNLNPIGSTEFEIVDVGLNTNHKPIKVKQMRLQNTRPKSSNSKLRQVIIHFYENEKQLTTAYNTGEIDIFGTQVYELAHPYEKWNNSVVTTREICGKTLTVFYKIDPDQETLYDNHSFQVAFRSAIENSGIYSKPINSPINSRSWAYNHELSFEPYSNEKIREILAGQESTLTSQDNGIVESVAQDLVSSLQKYDFTLKLETVSNAKLKNEVLPERNFEMLLALQKIAYDPDQFAFWHSSQTNVAEGGLNISNYTNRQVDKSLEDGRASVNEDLRKPAYLTMQARLLEDQPALFLKHPPMYEVSRINVDSLNSSKSTTGSCLWHVSDYFPSRLGIN